MKIYLAGPMSGIPQFNFPEFFRVGSLLRKAGYDVVSPAELDDKEDCGAALQSKDGDPNNRDAMGGKTWGDFLARDVKLLADTGIKGIVFLPGWQKSRGARLEASLGLLSGFAFHEWAYDSTVGFGKEYVREMTSLEVAAELFFANTKAAA